MSNRVSAGLRSTIPARRWTHGEQRLSTAVAVEGAKTRADVLNPSFLMLTRKRGEVFAGKSGRSQPWRGWARWRRPFSPRRTLRTRRTRKAFSPQRHRDTEFLKWCCHWQALIARLQNLLSGARDPPKNSCLCDLCASVVKHSIATSIAAWPRAPEILPGC